MSLTNYKIEVTHTLSQQGLTIRTVEGFIESLDENAIDSFIDQLPICPTGFRRESRDLRFQSAKIVRQLFQHRVDFVIRETEIAA